MITTLEGDAPPICQMQVLASGSSGNAVYIRIADVHLLIDAGISRRRITRALDELGVSLQDLSALVLTHEHSDHVSALEMLRRARPDLPVFATNGTAQGCRKRRRWVFEHTTIRAGEPFEIGAVTLTPFATSHDAMEPIGLRVEGGGHALGIATDMGRSTSTVVNALRDCSAIVLEANYDEEMLWRGPYPLFLKRRVASPKGHLSNLQMRALLGEVAGPRLEQVILGHLSEKNNTPQKAVAAVGGALANAPRAMLSVADRQHPGPLMSFA